MQQKQKQSVKNFPVDCTNVIRILIFEQAISFCILNIWKHKGLYKFQDFPQSLWIYINVCFSTSFNTSTDFAQCMIYIKTWWVPMKPGWDKAYRLGAGGGFCLEPSPQLCCCRPTRGLPGDFPWCTRLLSPPFSLSICERPYPIKARF